MQVVKEKLSDMNAIRKAKTEARAEEKAEKDLARAREDVAHEMRLAKEAKAEMQLHVDKAGQKVEREMSKHEGTTENENVYGATAKENVYGGSTATGTASNNAPTGALSSTTTTSPNQGHRFT